MISVLCITKKSNYRLIPGLDLWDKERDAYNYTGTNPVIAHPPCAQWSQLRGWAKPNEHEKQLAWFCLEKIQKNGGILEHPAKSSFFKAAGIKPSISVDQSWWGFPARKPTWLYFNGYPVPPAPISFDAIIKRVEDLPGQGEYRSKQPLNFCLWLISAIQNPYTGNPA